ncbi:tau-cadinol synthase-like [Lolium rigidum]|uniref:tau-cadinol synthase-like n=1 Tax=Lolium rigidum TaxID=89674 RepID=UPI001F5D540E|nr:tau-cadinol synthase-like [Lolium rigidum]
MFLTSIRGIVEFIQRSSSSYKWRADTRRSNTFFKAQHLESISGSLKSPLANQVKRALHRPLPRSCKRVETLKYIPEYEEEEGHSPTLLELAKLDFNLLQHVYLKELKSATEWWNHFSGYIKLDFIRDRLVESYTWAYVLYYEKDSALPRSILTKIIVLITTLDDIYDIRASTEECRKLHEAIQSWDESAISLLPEYLRNLYKELLRTFKNIEDQIPVNMNYDITHLKKSIQKHVTGYLQEAEWSHKSYKPSFKDQVNLTCLTIGAPSVCTSMMVGMGDPIMKQALEWTASVPDVVVAAGKVVRLMNDIAAFEVYIVLQE